MPVNIAIVEDNTGLRSTWEQIINAEPGYRCVCSCQTAEAALARLPAVRPQVVLMDIHLPNLSGIECTAQLKQLLPETQILMLTVYADSDKVFQALQAGANGYLLKRTTPQELFEAIRQVLAGGAPMSGEIARKVIESFRAPSRPAAGPALSRRERETLDLLAQGYSDKEISERLHVSYETVRSHLKHIYEKLHVRSRTEAALKYLGRSSRSANQPVANP
jgi:DNA-binding NarL/FixJ family response regulator